MKKVLTSQERTCEEKIPGTRPFTAVPKPTILNNYWNVRNDSSNISEILNPPKLASVYKKCCLSTNTCYCREKAVKPKIMKKPQKCLKLDEEKESGKGEENLWRGSLKMCQCDGSKTDVAVQKSSVENSKDLDLTKQRREYEIYRLKENESMPQCVRNLQENAIKSYSTIPDTKTVADSGHFSSSCCTESGAESLKSFRKNHYFETHSIDNLDKEVSEHVCVHKFKLDDRLLPNPVNCDVYGRSRCSICSKPMPSDAETRCTAESEKSWKKTLKSYEWGLTPRTISFGGENTRVELSVCAEDVRKMGSCVGKFKRPQYVNSFALRHQKMAY